MCIFPKYLLNCNSDSLFLNCFICSNIITSTDLPISCLQFKVFADFMMNEQSDIVEEGGCLNGTKTDHASTGSELERTRSNSEVSQDRIYAIEDGFYLLTRRMKNDIKTVKEMIAYLRKRMAVEEEYVKLSSKVSKHCHDLIDKDDDLKQGTFKAGWRKLLTCN